MVGNMPVFLEPLEVLGLRVAGGNRGLMYLVFLDNVKSAFSCLKVAI